MPLAGTPPPGTRTSAPTNPASAHAIAIWTRSQLPAMSARSDSGSGASSSASDASSDAPPPPPEEILRRSDAQLESLMREAIARGRKRGLFNRGDKSAAFKLGSWTQDEERFLSRALDIYARIKGLSRDDTSWLWPGRAKGPSKDLTWVLSVAMPHRRQRSLLEKAQGMAQRDQGRKPWTTKDDRALRAAVAARGPKWVAIGAELGRPPDSCKYRHREIAGGDAMRKGAWDADEDARLQQAVEKYMEAAGEGRPFTKGDGVNWVVVAQAVGGRGVSQCRLRWYGHVSPSMRERGLWGGGHEDRSLLRALWGGVQVQGWRYEFQVEWDKLVTGRAGSLCRRRWGLMKGAAPLWVRRRAEFAQMVDYLMEKHLPKEIDNVMVGGEGPRDSEGDNSEGDSEGGSEGSDGGGYSKGGSGAGGGHSGASNGGVRVRVTRHRVPEKEWQREWREERGKGREGQGAGDEGDEGEEGGGGDGDGDEGGRDGVDGQGVGGEKGGAEGGDSKKAARKDKKRKGDKRDKGDRGNKGDGVDESEGKRARKGEEVGGRGVMAAEGGDKVDKGGRVVGEQVGVSGEVGGEEGAGGRAERGGKKDRARDKKGRERGEVGDGAKREKKRKRDKGDRKKGEDGDESKRRREGTEGLGASGGVVDQHMGGEGDVSGGGAGAAEGDVRVPSTHGGGTGAESGRPVSEADGSNGHADGHKDTHGGDGHSKGHADGHKDHRGDHVQNATGVDWGAVAASAMRSHGREDVSLDKLVSKILRRQGMQGVAGAEEAAMQGLRQSALVRVEGQRVYLVQP